MKIKLLFLLITLFSIKVFSQSEYILGTITNESGDKLPNATIYNLRTDQVVESDKMGNFAIQAKASDELRIVRQGYERKLISLTSDNFSKSLEIKLTTIPQEIEEVKLSFKPTGILKKDVTRLNPPAKVVALNGAMNNYMRTPLNEVAPKASTPSAFKQPDFAAGQLNLMKLAGAISGLVGKATSYPKTTADYSETQEFYKRVKSVVDMRYYTEYGLDEYDFDIFLAYADKAYDLAKNYRKNFNKVAIEFKLKEAFTEYIKTHSFSKKQSEG
ncbi:carboxypeptidase-like regulatory domain-containing protein [Epilithonimonas sp.]|uniref:carboxypeptidase-like regulatory domain-containing protein n=1 Tax=Epilithonimonas sp. TaxID=2894511 RepID=UPI0028A18C1E|nr:carboxypeptidase-like regulatory domain-containing protein [Epilithonimonas sp.]